MGKEIIHFNQSYKVTKALVSKLDKYDKWSFIPENICMK